MARITIDVDLPPEVEITGYQRYQDGHGLEVRWPLPARCRCEKCGHDDVAHIEFKTIPQAIRDLNLWEQPCFWIYQAPFHRCARCNYRQHIIPPFKRKDVSYTYRFEQFVLRSLIGSTAEEVARRLGISAETVDRIVENQLTEDRQIDPQRVITDIGLDELSLKKRHRLYVTLMTDLSDPTRPQILAVERGRDTTATLKCLDRLTQEQRQQDRTHRVDMGPAYPAACALRLPHSRAVTDRFHVAKKFNEVVDSLRKNITREYKAKLTKDQRKAFRSQMWAFRRDPESLSAEEKQALEALFEKIPALRPLYKVRLRFKEIFDTAHDRITAARWLRELRRECGQLGLDLGSFFETYDRWKTKILNYFDARQTSAAVEGINNKARVITKRTYGLKSAKSLWDRLILDLNRASQAIGYSIEHIRQMAKGLKALFDWFRSLKNPGKVFHAQSIERGNHWQPPDDLGDHPEGFEVFWLYLPQQPISHLAVFGQLLEPEPTPPETLGDDVFEPDEGPSADKQDVGRVEGDAGLHGVLIAARRRHRGDRAFDELQESVLDALPQIFEARATPLNLVDLIDVDDATLSNLDVTFGCLDQLRQQGFHIISNIACLGQTRGISDDQRDVQIGSQGLDQVGLPTAGRSDQEDV